MVLSFGLLQSGLFAESEATGVGLGSSTEQNLIDGVGTGLYYLGIYTGAGFDSAGSGAAGSNVDDHTLQLSATTLLKSKNVFLLVTVTAAANGGLNSASTYLKVETQETGGGGGGWSNLLGLTTLCSGTGTNAAFLGAIELVKVLTAGELTKGLDIKITTTSTWAANCSASVTNKNVTIRGSQ